MRKALASCLTFRAWMQRAGGNKWDECSQDMKEFCLLQKERARAWD